MPVGQGRVLGGGSSVNVMIWMRGYAHDFDTWAAEGCAGWGFDDVLPFFKNLENWEGGANRYRATGGPIQIRHPSSRTDLAEAWIAGGRALGLEHFDDVNAPMRAGVGYANLNIDHDGRRSSSATAYLHPALSLPNLKVASSAQVARLLFTKDRCVGCELVGRDDMRVVHATHEVIVTAGGIGSPHLLLRSGIGDPEELAAVGLKTVSDLPQVGRNYQDHPMIRAIVMRSRNAMPPPDAASNHAEVCALIHSGEGESDKSTPDLLAVAIDQPTVTSATEARYGSAPPPGHGFTLAFGLMRPTSRGSVRLAAADWRTPPTIDNGLLQTELDLRVAVRGIEHLRELSQQPVIRSISDGEALPGPAVGRAAFDNLVRDTTHTFWHPAGTCGMGPPGKSVVDPDLRVHGIRGLRVCDSSIMPISVSCPTNAASCMIALKAAELILRSVSDTTRRDESGHRPDQVRTGGPA